MLLNLDYLLDRIGLNAAIVWQMGICHGDLNKLDNIMWDEDEQEPFLIDFGLGCWLEDRVHQDMKKHSRKMNERDVSKKLNSWRGYDTNHLRAKFDLN